MESPDPDRRTFLKWMGAGMTSLTISPLAGLGGNLLSAFAQNRGTEEPVQPDGAPMKHSIPSTGEEISPIGMGTWITFNVGNAKPLMNKRTKVLAEFFRNNGGVVDSSPMYGSAEKVVGYGLSKLRSSTNGPDPSSLFSATKVWTPMEQNGPEQIQTSKDLWNLQKFDLLQVHNLVDWQTHLDTLFDMKERGDLRYVGITTSHGRRHKSMKRVMKNYPVDFAQMTYNLRNRAVEEELLPVAQEEDIAVIANRPFQGGSLVKGIQRSNVALPQWASEIDCLNWPQFLLKFIISHPAVTCAIPATTKVIHMKENKGAARGSLPDANQRREMLEYVQTQYW